MNEPCPFCKGKGRTEHRYDAELPDGSPAEGVVHLLCDACTGTGDYLMMQLVRAFRLGQQHEHLNVIARISGGTPPTFPRAETIKSAVLNDERRQRYEDALAEGRAA